MDEECVILTHTREGLRMHAPRTLNIFTWCTCAPNRRRTLTEVGDGGGGGVTRTNSRFEGKSIKILWYFNRCRVNTER